VVKNWTEWSKIGQSGAEEGGAAAARPNGDGGKGWAREVLARGVLWTGEKKT